MIRIKKKRKLKKVNNFTKQISLKVKKIKIMWRNFKKIKRKVVNAGWMIMSTKN